MRDTPFGYGSVSKMLHWLVAALVLGALAVGLLLEDLPNDIRGGVMGIHKSVGVIVLVLMVLRLAWRLWSRFPKLPAGLPPWQARLARLAHVAFYPLLILMPLSGWAMSSAAGYPTSVFGLVTLPMLGEKNDALRELFSAAHSAIAWMIIILLAAHIGAAIYHHYFQGQKTIRRML